MTPSHTGQPALTSSMQAPLLNHTPLVTHMRPAPSPSSSPFKLKKPHPLHDLRLKHKPPHPHSSHPLPSPPLPPAPPPPPPPAPLSPSSLTTLFSISSLHEAVALLEEENEGLRHRIEVGDVAVIARLEEEVRRLKRDRRGGREGVGRKLRVSEVERLEEEVLQLRCEKLDLLFVSEEWKAKEQRLLRRLAEAERVRDLLSAVVSAGSGEGSQGVLVMKEVEGMMRELEDVGGLQEEAEGEGGAASRVRVVDVLGVLRLVKRVVLKLKAEADEWRRKTDGREDAEKVQKERRLWEKRLKEAEEELQRDRRSSLRDDNDRLALLVAQLKKDVKREKEDTQRLRRHLEEARAKAEQREVEFKAQLERRDGQWQQRLDAVDEQLRGEKDLIGRMKEQLDSSMQLIHRMQREMEDVQADKASSAGKVEEKREEGGEVQRLRAELERLQKENAAYAAELSAFDEAFFEEIEDLKFRYSQALQLIQQLQAQQPSTRDGGS